MPKQKKHKVHLLLATLHPVKYVICLTKLWCQKRLHINQWANFTSKLKDYPLVYDIDVEHPPFVDDLSRETKGFLHLFLYKVPRSWLVNPPGSWHTTQAFVKTTSTAACLELVPGSCPHRWLATSTRKTSRTSTLQSDWSSVYLYIIYIYNISQLYLHDLKKLPSGKLT